MINVLLPLFLLLLPAMSFSKETTVLLWVPSESFSDWAALSRAFQDYDKLRLTIGLTPEMAGEPQAGLLKPWLENGRLEIALRIDGDPLLPIIALEGEAPRPQDVVNRLALSRESFRRSFSSAPPAGFVPGGGFFSPELLPTCKAMGLSWVATGGEALLSSGDGPVPVYFRPPGDGSPLIPENALLAREGEETAFVVIDEASGRAAPGSLLTQLAFLSKEQPRQKWLTVGQALAAAQPLRPNATPERPGDAAADAAQHADHVLKSSASWARDLYFGTPAQDQAWAAYHAAAAALKRYQNSGLADLKALEEATHSLYAAQASSLYRRLSDPLQAAAAGQTLRATLRDVYRRIKAPSPSSLMGAEETGDLAVSRTETSLVFENSKSTGPGRLERLAISWTPQELTFLYRLAPGLAGLDAVRLDTYIDLNGRPGAGSTALLEGRSAYAQNRDAWEFALEVFAADAKLWRSSPSGPPEEVGRFIARLDEARSEVSVSVPRAKLPGNPLRWGYIAFPLAPGESAPLNVLGPKEAQKGGRRLSAVGVNGVRR